MKKLLVIFLTVVFSFGTALSESEFSSYPLGSYTIVLPSDWSTTYNSSISILSNHPMSNGNYDHILTAVLMSLGDPIDDDAQFEALCDLIVDEYDISISVDDDLIIDEDRVYVWTGIFHLNEAAGAIYCHDDTALVVIHMTYGLSEDERFEFEKNIVSQIVVTE